VLYPFLPFSSQKLHRLLGFSGRVEESKWGMEIPPPGQKLAPPEPLYVKIEERRAEEETRRLGVAS
jgi:methionyl-tRNA synthetase